MKMKSLFFYLLLAVLVHSAVLAGGGPRVVVVVASFDYPTIQSAVYSADLILVEPGYYAENVFAMVQRDVTIRSWEPQSAIIDGGQFDNTFSFRLGSGKVTLQDMVIINRQQPNYYSTAAVFVEFGPSVVVQGCKIYSASNGLTANYTNATSVENSEFYGIGNQRGTTGLRLAHQNYFEPDGKGARVIGNFFANLGVGIDLTCTYAPAVLSDGPSPDSNSYFKVKNPITQLSVCQ